MITLFNKEGLIFVKNCRNSYSLNFRIKNDNIILESIVDFPLIRLLYDLNTDIYESIHMENVNTDTNNEIIFVLVIKHLFEELGMTQRFLNLHMVKHVDKLNGSILFNSQSIHSSIFPENVPKEAELLPIKNMNCHCLIITQNIIDFSCNITFDEWMNILPISEKLVGFILFKIFKRIKQFIENLKV